MVYPLPIRPTQIQIPVQFLDTPTPLCYPPTTMANRATRKPPKYYELMGKTQPDTSKGTGAGKSTQKPGPKPAPTPPPNPSTKPRPKSTRTKRAHDRAIVDHLFKVGHPGYNKPRPPEEREAMAEARMGSQQKRLLNKFKSDIMKVYRELGGEKMFREMITGHSVEMKKKFLDIVLKLVTAEMDAQARRQEQTGGGKAFVFVMDGLTKETAKVYGSADRLMADFTSPDSTQPTSLLDDSDEVEDQFAIKEYDA